MATFASAWPTSTICWSSSTGASGWPWPPTTRGRAPSRRSACCRSASSTWPTCWRSSRACESCPESEGVRVEVLEHRGADRVADLEHGRVGDRVVTPQALATTKQQARIGEQRELLGGVGLGAAQLLGQRTDGALAIPQQVDQPQAGGVAPQPE